MINATSGMEQLRVWIRPLRPPTGAPNVLIILLDDVGFGVSSAFGGPCQTPTADGPLRRV